MTTSGQELIRDIDVDKLAKGFADEEIILKKYCAVMSTKAREIRWYKKTAGFLDSTDTSGITLSQIHGVAFGAIPDAIEQSVTRETSHIRKFMVDSPMITDEDIKDAEIDIWGINVRDVTRAVLRQEEIHIYSVLGEAAPSAPTVPVPSSTNTAVATADGWNDTATGDPIADINTGIKNLRSFSYNIDGIVVLMNEAEEMHLKNYLINVKGSSIPQYASSAVTKNKILTILGCDIIVSTSATTDYVCMFIPKTAITYRQFMPITAKVIEEPLVGKKVRVATEGVALLTDPKAVHWITSTIV